MESIVFKKLRGSEAALTYNFFCESLITSLHTLAHVMEDADMAVPEKFNNIVDSLSDMGTNLLQDYQDDELDLGRFKEEFLDFYDLNFAVSDELATTIIGHDDVTYYYMIYMQGTYIFFPNMLEAFSADIEDERIIPFLNQWSQEFQQLSGSKGC